MAFENIHTNKVTQETDCYVKVFWNDKTLCVSAHYTNDKKNLEYKKINAAPPFSKEDLDEMYSVIGRATSLTNKYGYWAADALFNYLTKNDLDIRYRYDLAVEILENTNALHERETLIYRRNPVVSLDRRNSNKIIKALRRGARHVFGKDEW